MRGVLTDAADRGYQDPGFNRGLQIIDRMQGDAEDPGEAKGLRTSYFMRQIEGILDQLLVYPRRFGCSRQRFPLFWWPGHRADAR